jgi:L-ascorbate metabolism protein UlaG (beta-lactamase superfamily)
VDGLHHVGNSTHLIVWDGVRILTDPWVTEPADHVIGHRVAPAPLPRDVALVLVSHEHQDHFDPAALAQLDHAAVVVCPRALAVRVRELGFADVRGVAAGDQLDVCGLAIEVVVGKHSVPEVCFRVVRGEHALFFGGDTMLTPEIEALARAKPTPFVILPGERSSLLGRRHVMTPPEAVALAQRFGATTAVLSHHESRVTKRFPFGWMVRIPPPDPREFPPWFRIPSPGEHIAFPW